MPHQIRRFDKKLYNAAPDDKNFITARFLLMVYFLDLQYAHTIEREP